jgi:hypothetical protein
MGSCLQLVLPCHREPMPEHDVLSLRHRRSSRAHVIFVGIQSSFQGPSGEAGFPDTPAPSLRGALFFRSGASRRGRPSTSRPPPCQNFFFRPMSDFPKELVLKGICGGFFVTALGARSGGAAAIAWICRFLKAFQGPWQKRLMSSTRGSSCFTARSSACSAAARFWRSRFCVAEARSRSAFAMSFAIFW